MTNNSFESCGPVNTADCRGDAVEPFCLFVILSFAAYDSQWIDTWTWRGDVDQFGHPNTSLGSSPASRTGHLLFQHVA